MTLLDSTPPKPPSKLRRYLPAGIIFVVVVGALFTYTLWDTPEEHAVSHFLTTLERGNYPEAYRLWQPGESYSYEDFLSGWGEKGDYGRIRSFTILSAKSKGSDTVIVTVRINNVDPPATLLVDRKTKGLAYSPF
ncbi:MAG TPA: hypothetical protein VGW33_10910 [Terriglobia bacterium]|nr:hypothetical protein [Terriglobia bacterium]